MHSEPVWANLAAPGMGRFSTPMVGQFAMAAGTPRGTQQGARYVSHSYLTRGGTPFIDLSGVTHCSPRLATVGGVLGYLPGGPPCENVLRPSRSRPFSVVEAPLRLP